MSNFVYTAGLRNVGSYQVSGTPWVTGSGGATAFTGAEVHRFSFPKVTKSFTVINTGTQDIYLTFTTTRTFAAGAAGDGLSGEQTYVASDDQYDKFHYITIPAENGSVTMNMKCKEIYLANPHSSNTTGYEIFAELTQIPTGSMFTLTGAGIDG